MLVNSRSPAESGAYLTLDLIVLSLKEAASMASSAVRVVSGIRLASYRGPLIETPRQSVLALRSTYFHPVRRCLQ
jgi:hypothetical protein